MFFKGGTDQKRKSDFLFPGCLVNSNTFNQLLVDFVRDSVGFAARQLLLFSLITCYKYFAAMQLNATKRQRRVMICRKIQPRIN
jgi:hypothetical protein